MFKNFKTLLVVVTPDVFTVDDTGIESLISWETTFNQFKCFLTFNKVKTNTINWQVHKIVVDITNITKVSLNQDFKTFFISQEFVVEIQEESFFFSCQIFNKGWLIELNTSRTKLSQFCEDFLVSSSQAVDEVFSFYTIFKIRQLKESEWSNHNWACVKSQFFSFLVLIKNLVTSKFNFCCFFKFRNDVMVVSVKPFFHRKGTYIPFFTLVTTRQSKVTFKICQIQVLNRFRYDVEKESCIKEVIVM